jgi:hypothetical protein
MKTPRCATQLVRLQCPERHDNHADADDHTRNVCLEAKSCNFCPRDTGYQKGAGTLECSPMRYGRHCRNCSFGRWTRSPSEHHCGAAGSLHGGSLCRDAWWPLPEHPAGFAGPVLPAAFARDGDKIEVGQIYVAPPDHHMVLGFDSIRLNQGPKVHYTGPLPTLYSSPPPKPMGSGSWVLC